MTELREATAADRDAIRALRARCFPHEDAEKADPRFWEWEFRDGRMFVAEAKGRVVCHLGFVPQTYVVDSQQVPALLAVDAMTDPEFRGQRLFGRVAAFAGERIANATAFSPAWQIRAAVRGGIEAGGWEEVGGARVLIRPLTLRFALSLSRERERGAPQEPGEGMLARMSEMATWNACVARTPSWLRWRYFENPLWRYDVTMNDGAWLVTRRTMLKGFDTLAIVDIAWQNKSDAAALLGEALRETPTTLAAALLTRAHPAFWFLVRRGFLPGPHRFNLLVNDFSLRARPRWALAWGDTDHL